MNLLKVACASLALSSLASAESLTLQDAVHTAELHSPRVQMATSQREESYWRKVEAGSAFLPTITGEAQYITDYKYLYTDLNFGGQHVSIPGIVPTTIYGLEGNFNLFDGFNSTNRLRSSVAGERAAEHDLDWAKFETDRQVTLEFYRALAAKQLRAVSESNLKTLQDHLHDATLLRHSGLSTNYDVLRVEVQVSEAQSDLLNTSDDIETANGHLAEVLNLDAAPDPQGTLPELPADAADKIGLSTTRLDVAALQDRVEASRLNHLATSSHWSPRVGIFGNYQYYNNLNDHYDDWKSFRNAYEIGVRLTWDIFEGFRDEARNRQAAEKNYQDQKSLRIAQLKATQDVAVWRRKFKYFTSVYRARQSDIGKAKESVRLAREGRRVGSRTNTDLLDAETDLFRSQAGAIHAQLGVIEALINLELATGLKLYDFK